MSDREEGAKLPGSAGDGEDVLTPVWTGDGHLEEGSIHTWLDGAFDASYAAIVEAHVVSCAHCGAAVAEARGFIAGASRMIRSLDIAPSGVVPQADAARTASRIVAAAASFTPQASASSPATTETATSAPVRSTASPHSRVRRAWYTRREWQAAAAVLLMVGGGTYVWSRAALPASVATAPVAARADLDSSQGPASLSRSSSVPRAETSALPVASPPAVAARNDVASDVASDVANDVAKDAAKGAAPARSASTSPAEAHAARTLPRVAAAVPAARAPAPDALSSSALARERRAEVSSVEAVAAGAAVPRAVSVGATSAGATSAGATSADVEANRVAASTASAARAVAPPPQSVGPVAAGAAAPRVAGGVARDVASDAPRGGVIAGKVVSPSDAPVEGAAVSITGTTIGVLTDARGDFMLRSPGDSAALLVRRLGYESSRLLLPTPPNDTVRAKVTLKASSTRLSAVVVQSAAAPLRERPSVGMAMAAPGVDERREQCWALRSSDTVPRSTALMGSAPPGVLLTTDLGVAAEATSQWIDWPMAGRETHVAFVRDATGAYRGTGVGSDGQWTLTLSRRGTSWDVLATRTVPGSRADSAPLAAHFVMSSAPDRLCRR